MCHLTETVREEGVRNQVAKLHSVSPYEDPRFPPAACYSDPYAATYSWVKASPRLFPREFFSGSSQWEKIILKIFLIFETQLMTDKAVRLNHMFLLRLCSQYRESSSLTVGFGRDIHTHIYIY